MSISKYERSQNATMHLYIFLRCHQILVGKQWTKIMLFSSDALHPARGAKWQHFARFLYTRFYRKMYTNLNLHTAYIGLFVSANFCFPYYTLKLLHESVGDGVFTICSGAVRYLFFFRCVVVCNIIRVNDWNACNWRKNCWKNIKQSFIADPRKTKRL